jgi:hypothetical protein
VTHPYKTLPKASFWKPSVSERNALAITDLYRKKFNITRSDVIATAGSCFAQHIARNLASSGYDYRDFEKPVAGFPEDQMAAFNYGVYSARYCNIYTARQLLQTFQRATGTFVPHEEFWASDAGVHDQFRPLVEPRPYRDVTEARAARAAHYAALRRLLSETDLFIFTFGLTEAWRDDRDGSILPVCPGTQAGTFQPKHHSFVNFTIAETLADFRAFMALCREVKPEMRFLLTVSPVPLVATASPEHVLVATTYSKSVLRAVAGELADSDPAVAYFPSYEIISSPPFRSMFFEPDMRGVSPFGVAHVMSHFFGAHDADSTARKADSATPASPATSRKTELDVVCEEMLLEKFVP